MIGIFDSGLGGLITLKEIIKKCPNYSTIYLGDLAHLPYGNKSKQTVTKLALQNVRFLISKKAKIIIIACNTASAYAFPKLKSQFPKTIFLDVIEPALQKAVTASKNGHIGVIGTKATIQSSAYQKAIKKINPQTKVTTQACPLLVPLIEEGWDMQPETEQILKKYLKPFAKNKIDTLILGCTHYPILKNKIVKILGPEVKIIDSTHEIVVKLKKYLKSSKIKATKKSKNQFFVTDFSPGLEKIASKFLSQKQPKFKKISP